MAPADSVSRCGIALIRDDQWMTVGIVLLCGDAALTALGFEPAIGGLGILSGIPIGLLGVWILTRPVGLVIDRRLSRIIVRGLIFDRTFAFADLGSIEIRVASSVGLTLAPVSDAYDCEVVIVLQDADPIVVRRGLTPARAIAEASDLSAALDLPLRSRTA